MIKRILSEPLFQFSILGLALFLLFNLVSPEDSDNKIVIDQYDIDELASKWNLQWQRDPTEQELKGLLDNYIKQEIYYREALAMRFDHNDEIVKRRMAQKMQFLTKDLAERVNPTDVQLEQFLKSHRNKYLREKLVSFDQIYFSPDKRENALSDAKGALNSQNPIGDFSSLRTSYSEISINRLYTEFGTEFAKSIDTINMSMNWQGPIKSGFGYHLVKVNKIFVAEPYELSQIRNRVIDDFQADNLKKVNDELFNSLLEKYDIILDFEQE